MVAVINRDECVGCGTCVDDCPSEAISMDGENIAVVNADECIDCGLCVDSCPTDAISME
ncbi:MAG: 4Fe-4S dicluster domain-containing protein [Methanococcoides sp.]|jgi:ferredoxin|uniref:Ferredoxin n=1 Tax=Methanococcoides seepicolus TaxID=2828780 RepID=A0A9E4ZFH9_9EURY|nr:4Fe-4S binding protein [Methanococcoides seepicolus]MCM1986690.1 4Fe-4S binding protein [Methanococcoides seepicolus]NOQ47954.1 4Fe-4S dicluster domain-containing protein [Methanococcoides sp.]